MPEVGSLHVAAAPGDTGQPLGNCLLALRAHKVPIPDALCRPYLGPRYHAGRVRRACLAWRAGVAVSEGDIPAKVARALTAGKIVGLYHGRSELGPRALGHRSILADPRNPTMRDYLNRSVKKREWYRPYGAAVLAEHAVALTGRPLQSPTMMVALPLTAPWRARLPAVCHVDGSCRLQTVRAEDCGVLRRILEAFHALTGVPAILNTSFNAGGKPMVETPEDALAAFASMSIDALAIDDLFMEKPAEPGKLCSSGLGRLESVTI